MSDELDPMIAAKLKDLSERCASFTLAVDAVNAQNGASNSASKFKAWKDSVRPVEVDFATLSDWMEDNADASAGELVGMLKLVDSIRDNLSAFLQSAYFATMPAIKPVDKSVDLGELRAGIVKDYELLKGMAEGNWFPMDALLAAIPTKMGKIGKMKEEGILLDIPKTPTEGPTVRSNSVLQLFVDGQLVEADNFSDALLKGLGWSLQGMRDWLKDNGKDFTPGIEHTVGGIFGFDDDGLPIERTFKFFKKDV